MGNLKLSKKISIACIFVLATIISSCSISTIEAKNESIKCESFEYDGGMWSSMQYGIAQKTIDSCEYIIIFGTEGRNIIHKANCRFCIERNKK